METFYWEFYASGKDSRYSGAKSAPFSHSIVLYFTVNRLKKFRSFSGSNTLPFNEERKSTTFVTWLLNHSRMRYPSTYSAFTTSANISVSYFRGSIFFNGSPFGAFSQFSISSSLCCSSHSRIIFSALPGISPFTTPSLILIIALYSLYHAWK